MLPSSEKIGTFNCSPCNNGSVSWIGGLRLALLNTGRALAGANSCTNASSASRRQHWMTSVTVVKVSVSIVARSMVILRVADELISSVVQELLCKALMLGSLPHLKTIVVADTKVWINNLYLLLHVYSH